MIFFSSGKNRLIVLCLFFILSFNCFPKPSKPLLLDAVLKSVDRSYPQILIACLEIRKAEGDYVNALGKFDPSIDVNTRSQPEGGYINNYADNLFNVPTLYNGLKLFGGYRIGRGDWPIYYQNYLTNSGGEYRAGLSLPLLRDRRIDKERTELFTREETIRMKQQDAAATKIKIYQETIKAYWQWVEAGFQLRTFRHLLNLAKERQNAIIQQAQQGDLPKLAIAENLQLIVQREQLVNQGEMLLAQAGINLSLYYRDANGKPQKPKESQLPASFSKQSIRPSNSISQLQQHPVLRKLENYSKIVKLKQNLARNELLPNLDATAYTFKQYGTGGYPLLIPQAAMIGVNFKFPIFQREAKGKLISTTSELQQVKTEMKFTYEQLNNQLANLLVAIKIYQQQVVLLNKELNLARQVERGETKKFYEGDSTLFLVNQREQTTAQVKLNWINAEVNLQEARALARFFSSTQ
ncbi:TolC family protein [Legionella pneumophila]|uniref:Multidrug efflux protein, outer membrane component n=1 Tax=Legionella pneumophila subsp. pascullei TaxID=91890 RepID=A0AAX2ITL4_LEGPN|nr:TolC family protein [Legionella pneumophila]AMP88395.1 multidrug transporter [Legionella pneumophila subsp. pascullei]AMP91304.1 multidrug transporter [Legionella pneumophila subsp. pascullei]AMP94292.1 multidrug transporter [Legionella pneumophila subsp. pascullei]SQG89079.1 multidrug efflux protein, outer membrane component [Legionella pneumophila subsp. pascullei]VEH04129.1 multidrug efflux protein, outer membrane component [Legionella pneumophila subsp. pascullei]